MVLLAADDQQRRWRSRSGLLVGQNAATEPRVADNPQASRYELWLGTTRAGLIEYRSKPGVVFLVHTQVDPAFEGQGLGERLVAGALADLRARGLKLVPRCPLVRGYLRCHPDQADLVAGDPAVPGDQ